MAFSLTTWTDIGGQSRKGAAPQVFGYTTTDTAAQLLAANYFNAAQPFLGVGDFIEVNGLGSATPHAGKYQVTVSTAGGAVTVVRSTAYAVT